MQILDLLKKGEEKMEQKVKIENLNEISRDELIHQKLRLDEKIKRFDKRQADDKIVEALRKLHDITEAVSDIQNALNVVWKRTKQVEEDLKEALKV